MNLTVPLRPVLAFWVAFRAVHSSRRVGGCPAVFMDKPRPVSRLPLCETGRSTSAGLPTTIDAVADRVERIEVYRGAHKDLDDRLVGPLPGVRLGNIAAYEFELPHAFTPWPGQSLLERVFVLLDLGISMSKNTWRRWVNPGGVSEIPAREERTWYVDLISVEEDGRRMVFRDLFVDAIVPADGRHPRILDLEELADAVADGLITWEVAASGLRRWQQFLDQHFYTGRWPGDSLNDFPPAALRPLIDLPTPLAPPVKLQD